MIRSSKKYPQNYDLNVEEIGYFCRRNSTIVEVPLIHKISSMPIIVGPHYYARMRLFWSPSYIREPGVSPEGISYN